MNPNTTGTNTTGTNTTGTNTTGTNTTGTAGAGAPVTVTEIADLLHQLRALSGSSTTGRDTTAERAAFLARKADLLARITATNPDLTPPTATPPTTRADGGRA